MCVGVCVYVPACVAIYLLVGLFACLCVRVLLLGFVFHVCWLLSLGRLV